MTMRQVVDATWLRTLGISEEQLAAAQAAGQVRPVTAARVPRVAVGRDLFAALPGAHVGDSLSPEFIREQFAWGVETIPAERGDTHTPVSPSVAQFVRRNDNDTILGVVGGGYTCVQNENRLSELEALVDDGWSLDGCGVVSGGARCWFRASMPLAQLGPLGDPCNFSVVANWGHDGGTGVATWAYLLAKVCQNGMVGIVDGIRRRTRHTAKVHERLTGWRADFSRLAEHVATTEERILRLVDTSTTPERTDDIIRFALGSRGENDTTKLTNTIEDVRRYVTTAPGQTAESRQGTLWGVVNAVSYYTTHYKGGNIRENGVGPAASRLAQYFTMGTADSAKAILGRAVERAESYVAA